MPVLGVVLVAVALAAGSPNADKSTEHALYVAAVEQAKGHLLASREVYRRGQRVRTSVHASHPIQELGYRLWRPVTKVDPDLGARLQTALKEPGNALQAGVPASAYDKLVDQTLALLDRGVARVVPAECSADPNLHARVVHGLLAGIEEEYGEAIADGRVVLEIEYQDAWGFFQRLRARWAALRTALERSPGDLVSIVEREMAVLGRTFRTIDTPSSPVPVERVTATLNAIVCACSAQHAIAMWWMSDRAMTWSTLASAGVHAAGLAVVSSSPATTPSSARTGCWLCRYLGSSR